jgi:deoxyribonuclease V
MPMSNSRSSIAHAWNVPAEQARQIQQELCKRVILDDGFAKIDRIAGVAVLFSRDQKEVFAGCVLLSFPGREVLAESSARRKVVFPYTPGFFAFTAGPVILAALEKIEKADLIIFPGRGVAHPRGLGLASHLGVLLDVPTVAVSKTPLWKDRPEPASRKGAFTLVKGEEEEYIGAVVRTRENIRPIFVTPGHRISAQTAVRIVLDCCPKYRLPGPLRLAHTPAKKTAAT